MITTMSLGRSRAWVAIAAAGPLYGCASGADLIAAGRATLEPRIDRTLRAPPAVLDHDGELVISGRLERGLMRDLGGHIDVTVTGPDGVIVYEAQVEYQADYVPPTGSHGPRAGSFRRAHTRYGSYGVYSVAFPGLPPDGSVVRVKHDRQPHDPDARQ
jgi:hypothetical protein